MQNVKRIFAMFLVFLVVLTIFPAAALVPTNEAAESAEGSNETGQDESEMSADRELQSTEPVSATEADSAPETVVTPETEAAAPISGNEAATESTEEATEESVGTQDSLSAHIEKGDASFRLNLATGTTISESSVLCVNALETEEAQLDEICLKYDIPCVLDFFSFEMDASGVKFSESTVPVEITFEDPFLMSIAPSAMMVFQYIDGAPVPIAMEATLSDAHATTRLVIEPETQYFNGKYIVITTDAPNIMLEVGTQVAYMAVNTINNKRVGLSGNGISFTTSGIMWHYISNQRDPAICLQPNKTFQTSNAAAYHVENTTLNGSSTGSVGGNVWNNLTKDQRRAIGLIKRNSDGGYSISIGDQEWTFHLDQEETVKMEGIVSVPSGSCLRLREGPSVDTQILAGVNNGGKVEVLEKQGEWYKVKYNDKTGYMHEDYLKVTETTIQENSSNTELFNTAAGLNEINGNSANVNGNVYVGYSNYTVRVTYTAKVNSDNSFVFGDSGNDNKVVLTWKRTSSEYYDTLIDDAHVFSFGIDLTKAFSDKDSATADKEGLFSHVKFKIKNQTDGYWLTAALNAEEGIYYVTGHAAQESAATVFTPVTYNGKPGQIMIKGCEDDTYVITEIETANGYTLLKDHITVEISAVADTQHPCGIYAEDTLGVLQNDPHYSFNGGMDLTLANIPQRALAHTLMTASATVDGNAVNMITDNGSENAEAPLKVVNTPGFDLPQTGDTGTWMFGVVGIVLMAFSGIVVLTLSKSKKNRK